MKAIHWTIAAASLAFVQPTPALAAQSDPEVLIYRGAGVTDVGGSSFIGTATAVHCTNFSGVDENIRFVIRSGQGALLANRAITVSHLNTATVVTKPEAIFTGTSLITGGIQQGTVAVASTSINVTCTAMLVQADLGTPVGIALHMTRFNPIPATEE